MPTLGELLIGAPQLEAYGRALHRTVSPSDVVWVVGPGTGILSLLACRFGARRVFAIERSELAELLLEVAKDNGYADRIVVLQDSPFEQHTLTRPDVIVSAVDALPLGTPTALADLADICRQAGPVTRVMPASSTLWFAVASVPEAFDGARAPWQARPYGIDLRSVVRYVDNSPHIVAASPQQLLGDPVQWSQLEVRRLDRFRPHGCGRLRIESRGLAHGVLTWSDTEVAEGIRHSNAPGPANGSARQMFLPWPEAVVLEPGDQVSIDIRGDVIGGEVVWTWRTEISTYAGGTAGFGRATQTSFFRTPVTAASLRRRSTTLVPYLSTVEGVSPGEHSRRL